MLRSEQRHAAERWREASGDLLLHGWGLSLTSASEITINNGSGNIKAFTAVERVWSLGQNVHSIKAWTSRHGPEILVSALGRQTCRKEGRKKGKEAVRTKKWKLVAV